MAIRVGIVGGGWPGLAHAQGYAAAGGYKIVAAADLIPDRRKKLVQQFGIEKEFSDAKELIKQKDIDVISVCLPTFLHAPVAAAALKAGKHVVCEKPPAMSAREARKIQSAAMKKGKVLIYALQRRFGAAEQAARQAIEKGYAGEAYHARASWMRTRGIPIGTGWFSDKSKSGGGAMIDIGVHVLDLAWYLLGQPKPTSAFAVTCDRFREEAARERTFDVEEAAFALIRFEGGKSLELSTSWAINQPPHLQGTVCRINGTKAAIDVYTPKGPTIYRHFDDKGQAKETPLPQPKVHGHAAMMRHLKDCIAGKATPIVGGGEGVTLMQIIDAIYASAAKGKSVAI